MDIEKIYNLFMSPVTEDALIAVRLFDNLSREESKKFKDNYMEDKSTTNESHWLHTNFALEFENKDSSIFLDEVYYKGKFDYYYIQNHVFCVDNKKNMLYWTTERNFVLKKLEEL